MTKILSARDLLEVVRRNEAEDRLESDTVVDATTLGRRIYHGTTKRAPRATMPVARRPAPSQGRMPPSVGVPHARSPEPRHVVDAQDLPTLEMPLPVVEVAPIGPSPDSARRAAQNAHREGASRTLSPTPFPAPSPVVPSAAPSSGGGLPRVSEVPPVQKKATWSREPSPARSTPPISSANLPTPEVAIAVAAIEPPQAKASASMFSWVTQRPESAPPQEALLPMPSPAHETESSEPRSLVADEPIALTSEETMVLIHFDRSIPIDALAERTGLSEFRIERVIESLRVRGVLEHEQPSLPPLAEGPDTEIPPVFDVGMDFGAEGSLASPSLPDELRVADADHAPPADVTNDDIEIPLVGRKPEKANVDEGQDDEDVDGSEDDGASEQDSLNYLKHFETVLSLLSPDERAYLAATGSGRELFALVFDKEPEVIRALWSNVNISIVHARYAAFNHRTALGLDLIGQRHEFITDSAVFKRLLRNPLIPEALIRRLLSSKRLLEIYKAALDREASEKTRVASRNLLRNRFATAEADDRVDLLWRTEARALAALSGLSIDSKTAALICSRPVVSVTLVQNFSRFAATPPSIIAHFLKQQLVRRQNHLKLALLKHPNCPSDSKRGV